MVATVCTPCPAHPEPEEALWRPGVSCTFSPEPEKQRPGAHVQELPEADWQARYEAGARVRARIIYVDAVSKRVCLSLLPHLLAGRARADLPPVNALFQVGFSGPSDLRMPSSR
jgi:hypothetical protein